MAKGARLRKALFPSKDCGVLSLMWSNRQVVHMLAILHTTNEAKASCVANGHGMEHEYKIQFWRAYFRWVCRMTKNERMMYQHQRSKIYACVHRQTCNAQPLHRRWCEIENTVSNYYKACCVDAEGRLVNEEFDSIGQRGNSLGLMKRDNTSWIGL